MPKKDKSDHTPSKRDGAGSNAKNKRAAEDRERAGASPTSHVASRATIKFLRGDLIEPRAIT